MRERGSSGKRGVELALPKQLQALPVGTCRRLSLKHTAHHGIGGLKESQAVEARQFVADQEAAATRATRSPGSLLNDDVKHQATQGRIGIREAKNRGFGGAAGASLTRTAPANPFISWWAEALLAIASRPTPQSDGRPDIADGACTF